MERSNPNTQDPERMENSELADLAVIANRQRLQRRENNTRVINTAVQKARQ